MSMTTAERIAAALGDDGQTWQTEDGGTLDDLATEAGARQEHAEAGYDMYGDMIVRRIETHQQHTGSVVRHLFPDGSALLVTADWWCIEGDEPFICAESEPVAPPLERESDRYARVRLGGGGDTYTLAEFFEAQDREVMPAEDRERIRVELRDEGHYEEGGGAAARWRLERAP